MKRAPQIKIRLFYVKIVTMTENSLIIGKVFVLKKKENGSCVYQDDKTKLCTIYENRPNACRRFSCIGRI